MASAANRGAWRRERAYRDAQNRDRREFEEKERRRRKLEIARRAKAQGVSRAQAELDMIQEEEDEDYKTWVLTWKLIGHLAAFIAWSSLWVWITALIFPGFTSQYIDKQETLNIQLGIYLALLLTGYIVSFRLVRGVWRGIRESRRGPEAMFNLGWRAEEDGDWATARMWYQRAADAGNSKAMHNLGIRAEQDGDRATARMWYQRAADAGNSNSMTNLGWMAWEDGDRATARMWYQRAADAGNSQAMTNLRAMAE